MNDYLVKVLQLDQSYLMRDIASVHQFAGFQDHIFALHNDFSECELVVGSISQVLGAKAEAHKTLQPFAAEDTPNELRLTQYGSAARTAVLNTTSDSPAFNNFGQYQKQEQPKSKEAEAQEQANVDPGIVIRGRQDVDEFLGSPQSQQPQKEDSDSYYYSDDEPQQQPVYSPPARPARPGLVKLDQPTRPTTTIKVTGAVAVAKPVVVVAKPKPVASPVARPAPQKQQPQQIAQAAPAKVSPKPVSQPAAAPAPAPAPVSAPKPAAPKDDLMSLFGASAPQEKPAQQA